MTYQEFIAEVEHEAKALDRGDPSYSSHGSVWQATLSWLDGFEAEEFRTAISTLLPPGDQIGPRTLDAIGTVGHTAERNTIPPGRVVRVITALALDRIHEKEKTDA